jgi:hypothetical protein
VAPGNPQPGRLIYFLPRGEYHLESDIMNQTAFTKDLATELNLRGTTYDPVALAIFVADTWPLIADDPRVEMWASQFAEQQPERHDGAGGVDDK